MAALVTATVKALGVLIDLALKPEVTAPILLLLCAAPSRFVSRFSHAGFARAWLDSRSLTTAVGVLLGLGAVRTVNRSLNIRARNNWRLQPHPGWNWPEEIAVVTGGCNGIGKEIVLGLVQKGVRVAVLDIADLPDDLAQTDGVFYWRCDVTSPTQVAATGEEIREKLGDATILVNNAGISAMNPILDVPDDTVSQLIQVNLLSHWYTVKAFLPAMVRKNKGHVFTIASLGSFVIVPTGVAYATSKAGLLAFYEGLASEIKHIYKAPGVMTSIIHPTYASTGLLRGIEEDIKRRNKIKSLLRPQDIAEPVLDQIFSRRGGQVFVPPEASWLTRLRGWPNWMQEGFRDIIGRRYHLESQQWLSKQSSAATVQE